MKTKESIIKVITDEDNFVLGSHVGPDGDSMGGLLALGRVLDKLGKNYCISSSDLKPSIPPQYNFLPNIESIQPYEKCFDPNIFISLECPSLERLGVNNKLANKAKVLINIDHHADNKNFGHINWVNPKISSVCEMIYELIKLLPVEIDKELATLLYVGIVTDTGRFQYSNVTTTTFEAAKALLEKGVDTNYLFQNIYENRSFTSTVLLGEVMAKAKFNRKKGFIYSTVTNEDFLLNKIGVGETEHFIDFLRAVKGVKVAAIFKEVSKNETKISLRGSPDNNVGKIAAKFGGGGHAAASGYTSKKPIKDAVNDFVSYMNNNHQ